MQISQDAPGLLLLESECASLWTGVVHFECMDGSTPRHCAAASIVSLLNKSHQIRKPPITYLVGRATALGAEEGRHLDRGRMERRRHYNVDIILLRGCSL